jgi:hypothetical protein
MSYYEESISIYDIHPGIYDITSYHGLMKSQGAFPSGQKTAPGSIWIVRMGGWNPVRRKGSKV